MARISGVNIPTNKKIHIALTYIFGIGPKIAETLAEAGITTFAQLAKTDAAKIIAILRERVYRNPLPETTA